MDPLSLVKSIYAEKQSEESLPHIFGNIFCCQVLTNITHLAAQFQYEEEAVKPF